jgi:hypothetical protein
MTIKMITFSHVKWDERNRLEYNTINQLKHLAAAQNIEFDSTRTVKKQMVEQIYHSRKYDPDVSRQCLLDSKPSQTYVSLPKIKYLPKSVCYVKGGPDSDYETLYIFKYSCCHERRFQIDKNGECREIPGRISASKSYMNVDIAAVLLFAQLFDYIEMLHVIKMINYLSDNSVILSDIKVHMRKLCADIIPKLVVNYIKPK